MSKSQFIELFGTLVNINIFNQIQHEHPHVYYCTDFGEDYITIDFFPYASGKSVLVTDHVCTEQGLNLPDFHETIKPLLPQALITYPLDNPNRIDAISALRIHPHPIQDPTTLFTDKPYKLLRISIAPHRLKFSFADLSIPKLTYDIIKQNLSPAAFSAYRDKHFIAQSFIPYGPPDIEITIPNVTNISFTVSTFQYKPRPHQDDWISKYWLPYTVTIKPSQHFSAYYDDITIAFNRVKLPPLKRCFHNDILFLSSHETDRLIILSQQGNIS